jgi:hypothetical protein
MKLNFKKIETAKLITPAHYGAKRGTGRKVVYYLMKEDRIDYTEIDGVMFVVLNEKSKSYKKRSK